VRAKASRVSVCLIVLGDRDETLSRGDEEPGRGVTTGIPLPIGAGDSPLWQLLGSKKDPDLTLLTAFGDLGSENGARSPGCFSVYCLLNCKGGSV
jgi:hypothetical protein